MKFLLTAYSLVLWTCIAFGQSVKLPAEVKGNPGSFIKISAETADKNVKWFTPDDSSLNLFPTDLLKDSKTAVVTALKPGRYRLYAYTAKADLPSDPAICIVVIGDAPPIPPDPIPPDPKPPTPPDDGRLGLVKASRLGLAAVTATDKVAKAKTLAGVHRSLASKIAAGGVTEPAAILDEWRAGNRGTVDPVSWKPWADSVSPAIAALHKAGKIPSKAEWVEVFNEIAKGLEQ